MLVTVK